MNLYGGNLAYDVTEADLRFRIQEERLGEIEIAPLQQVLNRLPMGVQKKHAMVVRDILHGDPDLQRTLADTTAAQDIDPASPLQIAKRCQSMRDGVSADDDFRHRRFP